MGLFLVSIDWASDMWLDKDEIVEGSAIPPHSTMIAIMSLILPLQLWFFKAK